MLGERQIDLREHYDAKLRKGGVKTLSPPVIGDRTVIFVLSWVIHPTALLYLSLLPRAHDDIEFQHTVTKPRFHCLTLRTRSGR